MTNTENPVFLFSQSTKLAHKIDEKFYKNEHYVWCSEFIHDNNQPPTSDPIARCNRLLQIIKTGDRHATEIDEHLSGILAGAKAKLKSKVISKEEHKLICTYLNIVGYEEFMPIIYIIDYSKVKERCEYVSPRNKASDSSSEIRITNLKPDEYTVIDMSDLLRGVMNIHEWNRGENECQK